MPDEPQREHVSTLASLRRRGRRPAPVSTQPDLFSGLGDASAANPPEAPRLVVSNSEVAPVRAAEAFTPPDLSHLQTGPTAPAVSRELSEVPERDSRTWTVSGLVRHIRGLVERGYGQVTVEGEISNWRPAGSGHCYFTVKDAGAQLSAVLFRRQGSLLRFRPADGDAVKLHGQLSIYESRGQMQLIVEWMEQVGLGAMLAEVQRLKEKLRREGLFDRKRPLPPFPRCIGIVTSLQGAALRDIIKVCRRRHASVQLLIYPAAVQGPDCPDEIAAGLHWFSTHPDRAEVVLVARGGGSWEDLHGFDDEGIARAIAVCALPVITGIGHATDSTIADAAADFCAPTPSAAAELLTAAHHRIDERLANLHTRLHRASSFELLRAQQRLARLGAATVLRRVEDGLNRRAQRLDELTFRAESALRGRLRRAEGRLRSLDDRLGRQAPTVSLATTRRRREALHLRLTTSIGQRALLATRQIDHCQTRLEALSPLRVLERGYALVYGPNGHLLRDASTVGEGQNITARLAQGSLEATVLPRPESPHGESTPG